MFVGADVVDIGAGPLLWAAHPHTLASHELRDLARRILQISRDDRLHGTDDDARRLQSLVHTVRAVVALGRRMRLRIDVQRVIRAGLHAALAADAALAIEVYDAVGPLEERLGRADGDTGRVVAVVAARDEEVASRVGELALLDVLHPRSVDADGHVVLGFAGDRAGVAADALALVDDEAILHVGILPGGARRASLLFQRRYYTASGRVLSTNCVPLNARSMATSGNDA